MSSTELSGIPVNDNSVKELIFPQMVFIHWRQRVRSKFVDSLHSIQQGPYKKGPNTHPSLSFFLLQLSVSFTHSTMRTQPKAKGNRRKGEKSDGVLPKFELDLSYKGFLLSVSSTATKLRPRPMEFPSACAGLTTPKFPKTRSHRSTCETCEWFS